MVMVVVVVILLRVRSGETPKRIWGGRDIEVHRLDARSGRERPGCEEIGPVHNTAAAVALLRRVCRVCAIVVAGPRGIVVSVHC